MLHKAFTGNAAYAHTPLSAQTILDKWEKAYDLQGFSSLLRYPKRVSHDESPLPNAYIMIKNKDICKFRPIVSYFRHPWKRLLRAAGRALDLLLQKAPVAHFNMPRVGQLRSYHAHQTTNY